MLCFQYIYVQFIQSKAFVARLLLSKMRHDISCTICEFVTVYIAIDGISSVKSEVKDGGLMEL